MVEGAKPRRRLTFEDRIVSGWNSLRHSVTEPLRVQLARARNEQDYDLTRERDPLVSVYIPTYNRAELLIERSVTSVLAQSYQNFELIIVGDHCTDHTAELVSQIQDPRIRFHNLPTRTRRYPDDIEIHWLAGGVVPANAALDLVCGKWVARVDDDDIWTPDHIESLLRFAQRGNYEFVSAQYEEERFGARQLVDGVRAESEYFTRRPAPPNDTSPKLSAPSTFFYRSYLRFMKHNIDCWRREWNRDNNIELSLRMYHAGVRIGFLEKVVMYVLPRPGEKTVGLQAYELGGHEKREHFKFEGQ